MTQVISEPTAQTVRAGVNERQFFANMANMFASSYSFLGELLQNARRAGASCVVVTLGDDLSNVQVVDDGKGVEDFQVLITLAQSGWDEQTVHAERPFGMGLFSALFAAKELVVRFLLVKTGPKSFIITLKSLLTEVPAIGAKVALGCCRFCGHPPKLFELSRTVSD